MKLERKHSLNIYIARKKVHTFNVPVCIAKDLLMYFVWVKIFMYITCRRESISMPLYVSSTTEIFHQQEKTEMVARIFMQTKYFRLI